MLVVPAIAATYLLDQILTYWQPYVRLYVNDFTLGPDTVLGSFTEAMFPGYVPLGAFQWTPSMWNGQAAFSLADPVFFTMGSPAESTTVHGYHVTGGPSGPLMWAEARPGGPITLTTAGQQLAVYPQMTFTGVPSP